MSNDRKQPHFTELVWESTEQNVPIPPRNSLNLRCLSHLLRIMAKQIPPLNLHYSCSFGIQRWKRRSL